MEECYQRKAQGHCSKGDSYSFRHDPASDNGWEAHRAKGQWSSPAPHSKAKTDGEIPSKSSGNGGESLSDKRGSIPRRYGTCDNPSSNYWHSPVCQNYKSETECIYGNTCYFRLVEAEGKAQQKVKERWCERISCLVEGVCTFGLCVSRFLFEEIHSTEKRKIGLKSRAPGTKLKFGKRVHSEELSKSVNFKSVVLARPGLRRGHKRRPCTKKDAPAEQRGTWRKIVASSRMRTKLSFTLPSKPGQCRRLLQNLQKSENSWTIQEHQRIG